MYRAILTTFAATMLVALQLAVSSPAQASSGLASFYGNDFAGRPTANGETFNPGALTAASLTLPFGTMVRVTNRHTGASVIVRINDRGPYVGGRIIDLSTAAAGAIGMIGAGVAAVDVEVVGSGSRTLVASNYRHRHAGVQVAARSTRHHHHANVQIASAATYSKRIALGMIGHRHHHGTLVAHAKFRHYHTGTAIAAGVSTSAEGFANQDGSND